MVKLVQNGKAIEASQEELNKTKKDLDKRAEQALVTTDENGIAINETQEAMATPTATLPESTPVDISTGTSGDVSIETNGEASPEVTFPSATSAAPKVLKPSYKPINIVV